jgi:hypothetical protein
LPETFPAQSECRLVSVANYERLIGAEAVERIGRKAKCLHDLHVVNPTAQRHRRPRMGERVPAFLLPQPMEDWLDLIASFEANVRLRGSTGT